MKILKYYKKSFIILKFVFEIIFNLFFLKNINNNYKSINKKNNE